MVVRSESTTWFDEIDLDPDASWLRMGTRQLGGRPWLVADEHRADELALKQRLCAERHADVFLAQPNSVLAGVEVLRLVSEELRVLDVGFDKEPRAGSVDLHPLDAAGRLVQEDLCLMRRDDVGWVLAAGSLCFPSRWRLSEKFGLPLAGVHQPVPGYEEHLSSRVDSLFDRLDSQIVWRRNWFVHPDDNLFQPDRPAAGDPTVTAAECADRLVLRSERQTLRRLAQDGWILFTIRIQQSSLGRFIEDSARRRQLRTFLAEALPEHAAHRGLSAEQVDQLLIASDLDAT